MSTVSSSFGHPTPYASRLSRRRIWLTTAAVMTAMFMAALEGTIVSTAMPTIVGELHGIDQYAWVFTSFLVFEVATIPLWGKLADMLGRKRVFQAGMTIFVVASLLCGFSGSMTHLIIFRALQGVGAGCLFPVAQTITADLFTVEQRARIMGYFTALFGLSSVIGPFLGGYFTDSVSWRWVFWIIVPFGVLVIAVVQVVLIEPLEGRRNVSIDLAGVAAVFTFTCTLIYALETGGREHEWGSPLIVTLFAVSIASIGWFIYAEHRATEPLMPLDLFSIPAMRATSVISFFLGATMMGTLSFLPLFMRTVVGTSATDAGRTLTPLMIGFMLSSFFGGRLLLRASFRLVIGFGMVFLIIGLVLLLQLGIDSTSMQVGLNMVILGLGMGTVLVASNIAAQNSVGRSRMGVTMSAINFTRQIGGTIGTAAAGAVMLTALTNRLADVLPGGANAVSGLLAPGSGAAIPPEAQEAVRLAFADALHLAFVFCAVIGAVAVISGFLVPRGNLHTLRHHEADEVDDDDPALLAAEMNAVALGVDAAAGVPEPVPDDVAAHDDLLPEPVARARSGAGARPGRSPSG